MNLYTFLLESFHISNTRSRFKDTDTVTFSLQVGNHRFPVKLHFAGDLNNGSYIVNDLVFGPVLISQETTTATFAYEIYNGGAGDLPVSLVKLNDNLLDTMVPLVQGMVGVEDGGFPNLSSGFAGEDVPSPENGDPFDDTSDWSPIFLEALGDEIASFFFPDCDGFVVGDAIGWSKEQWDKAIDSGGDKTLRKTMSYPGSNSPAGCGGNSDYTVTWSVTREKIVGSMQQFLKTRGINLHPGLRSLT